MERPKFLWNASDTKVSPVDIHAGVVHYCTVTFSVRWCQALKQFRNKVNKIVNSPISGSVHLRNIPKQLKPLLWVVLNFLIQKYRVNQWLEQPPLLSTPFKCLQPPSLCICTSSTAFTATATHRNSLVLGHIANIPGNSWECNRETQPFPPSRTTFPSFCLLWICPATSPMPWPGPQQDSRWCSLHLQQSQCCWDSRTQAQGGPGGAETKYKVSVCFCSFTAQFWGGGGAMPISP